MSDIHNDAPSMPRGPETVLQAAPETAPNPVEPVKRRRPALVALCGLLAIVFVAGCGGPFPQSTLVPESDIAARLSGLFLTIFWWAVAVFVLVEGALLVAIFKFRVGRDGDPGSEPRSMHGHTLLELTWTLVPALVLVVIAVPTMTTIWDVDRPTTDADALLVEVIGHQWWWEFRYPELDLVTANEMHIPAGRTIDLRLTSADVIHSFWFPRQAGKRDVIPGHENHLWFTADSVGRFPGQCAEFCGTSHALMKMEVVVETPEEFDAWAAAQTRPSPGVEVVSLTARDSADALIHTDQPGQDTIPAASAAAVPGQDTLPADSVLAAPPTQDLAAAGQQLLLSKGCIACHRIQGTPAAGVLGPDLSHVGSRGMIAAGILENSPENMIRWLSDPSAVKPGALMPNLQLNDEELRTLAAYLASLE